MDEKFDKAIDLLISQFKPGTAPKCDESLKYSQAILNLCHAKERMIQNQAYSQHLLEGKPKKPTS